MCVPEKTTGFMCKGMQGVVVRIAQDGAPQKAAEYPGLRLILEVLGVAVHRALSFRRR